MGISASVSEDKKTVTISISGQFNALLHREFRAAYKDSVANPNGYQFIVDLSKTDYMDSSALGMLLLLREHVHADSKSIVIASPNRSVRDILEIAKFDTMFTIT